MEIIKENSPGGISEVGELSVLLEITKLSNVRRPPGILVWDRSNIVERHRRMLGVLYCLPAAQCNCLSELSLGRFNHEVYPIRLNLSMVMKQQLLSCWLFVEVLIIASACGCPIIRVPAVRRLYTDCTYERFRPAR